MFMSSTDFIGALSRIRSRQLVGRPLADLAFWPALFAVILAVSPVWGQVPGGDFSRDEFLKTLTSGSEAAKRAALVQLDGHGDDPRVAELLVEVAKKARISGIVAESTLEMLYLLGKHIEDPRVPGVMWECLDSRTPKVVMIAVDALGELGDARALSGIIDLLKSPHFRNTYGFRKCVIEALMEFEDSRAVDALIGQLPELAGQLEYDVVRYLSHISRQRFGTQSELWETWWEDNEEDFDFDETEEEFSLEGTPSEEFAWDSEVSEFFDTYIYAKRLIFVLDISSSMRNQAGRGMRIELARQELAAAIAKLPDDTFFSVILFDANVAVQNKRLIQATEANRMRLSKWARQIQTGRGTNTFDALNRSFLIDGNAEAIFFLSDGLPSKGKITDPGQILQVITKENFFRRIALYSFGFAMGDADGEQFMKNLAEWNNGAYKAIR